MFVVAVAFGILRAFLMCVAGFAIGHGIDAGTWGAIAGLFLAIGTLTWGIRQHAITVDQFLSLTRGCVAAFGGWSIHKVWITSSVLALWSGLLSTLGPMAWTAIVHYNSRTAEAASVAADSRRDR